LDKFASVQPSTRPIIETLFARRAFRHDAFISDFAIFFRARQFFLGVQAFERKFAG
jgi:hypothetical protein